MQSLTVYSRFVVRALLSELSGDLQPLPALAWYRNVTSSNAHSVRRSFHLISASAGISKIHSTPAVANTARLKGANGMIDVRTTPIMPPSKAAFEERTFGDDAFFVAKHRLGDVLGVADGVGGWRTYGVDPSLFPTSLMAVCERMVREGRFNPKQPVDILSSSYAEVQQEKAPLLGSCTACVVALHRDEDTLYTANLGDSGFMVVREGKVVHRSEEQQHYFNTPYQLAVAPTGMEGLVLSDKPESALRTSFKVREGDIILLGTDGLFDNMKDEMILRHLAKLQDHQVETIQRVATSIANEAHHLGFSPNYASPFSTNAAANGFNFRGGKPDDVTVLIARVTLLSDVNADVDRTT